MLRGRRPRPPSRSKRQFWTTIAFGSPSVALTRGKAFIRHPSQMMPLRELAYPLRCDDDADQEISRRTSKEHHETGKLLIAKTVKLVTVRQFSSAIETDRCEHYQYA